MSGWLAMAAAAVGMSIVPFGNVSELLKKENPWFGFYAEDPVLWAIRLQNIPSQECRKRSDQLINDLPGKPLGSPLRGEKMDAAWGPWGESDLSPILECDSFPCDVKLNQAETSELASVPQSNSTTRKKMKYFELILKRVQTYLRTEARKEYEFPGDPVDPWSLILKRGPQTSAIRSTQKDLYLRRLDFASGEIKPIRQILDRRISRNPNGLETAVWLRDVYTNHYFDSWGEWTEVFCDPKESASGMLIQIVVLELDLLKKTDLISQLMRGKMKSEIEKIAKTYLDQTSARFLSTRLPLAQPQGRAEFK